MRGLLVFFAAMLPLIAQSDPEAFRFEVTALAWRTSVEGTLQSGILPIDLQSDLNLQPQWTFFGKLTAKPGRKHRIFIEGSPYSFDGRNALARSVTFNGRTYNVQDRIVSSAELTYVAAGYQYDVIGRPRGHLGFQVSGAYLDATGTLSSINTGISATRSQQIGLPLAGAEFRAFLIPSILSVSGEIKGMAFGDYGHFVQAGVFAGVGWHGVSLQAGWQILDADIHEANGGANPAGIAPRITGPIVGIQFRK
jgi:hypothetical protein